MCRQRIRSSHPSLFILVKLITKFQTYSFHHQSWSHQLLGISSPETNYAFCILISNIQGRIKSNIQLYSRFSDITNPQIITRGVRGCPSDNNKKRTVFFDLNENRGTSHQHQYHIWLQGFATLCCLYVIDYIGYFLYVALSKLRCSFESYEQRNFCKKI